MVERYTKFKDKVKECGEKVAAGARKAGEHVTTHRRLK